jgi:hypothetical protein
VQNLTEAGEAVILGEQGERGGDVLCIEEAVVVSVELLDFAQNGVREVCGGNSERCKKNVVYLKDIDSCLSLVLINGCAHRVLTWLFGSIPEKWGCVQLTIIVPVDIHGFPKTELGKSELKGFVLLILADEPTSANHLNYLLRGHCLHS